MLTFQTGARILSKGQEASHAYMIKSGRIKVFVEDGTKIVELAQLREGEIFGESALFNGEPYSAHIDAMEETVLQIITPDNFKTMIDGTDPIIKTLLNMMMERLKSTNAALVKSETREFMDIDLV